MSYYFSKILAQDFTSAESAVVDALKAAGFGVLTEIDVQATMKAKLGKEMPAYKILGACNPHLAFEALSVENKIGTMLPCNVILRETEDGKIEVAAVDPAASMSAVENPDLATLAGTVRDKMKAIIDRL